MMEDSTINVRHSDDATLRDEDEMNKNQRNVLQIGEKEKKSSGKRLQYLWACHWPININILLADDNSETR
jgi:hypothetical protein